MVEFKLPKNIIATMIDVNIFALFTCLPVINLKPIYISDNANTEINTGLASINNFVILSWLNSPNSVNTFIAKLETKSVIQTRKFTKAQPILLNILVTMFVISKFPP